VIGALLQLPGVETEDRDLIVSSAGFSKKGKIIVEVETHLIASDDAEAASLRAEVVQTIGTTLSDFYKEFP